MRILITGGNGYVGRALTRSLYGSHDVGVVDNLRIGGMRLTAEDLTRITFFQKDIRRPEEMTAAIDEFRPDAVVHLAAIHFIPECEANPADALTTNVVGTLNIVRACRPGTRFVFASTAAVYAPEGQPHREDGSPLGPMDIYGLTKLHGEEYVRYWSERNSLSSVIVRLFNVIGPGETNPHLLPAILAQALRNGSTLRLGNCHPSRDYVDIRDVVGGFSAIVEGAPSGEPVEIVNLGTGRAYSVYQVVDVLGRVAKREFSIDTDPSRVRTSDRPFVAADTTRIEQRYGWRPRQDLFSSLETLWREPDIPAQLLEAS